MVVKMAPHEAVLLIVIMVVMVMVTIVVVVMMPVAVMVVARVVGVPRIFAEYERLDRDRHRVRRQPDAAEVYVIEVPQRHAVDHQDLVLELELFAQYRAERLRDVPVQHDIERLAAGDGPLHALHDALRKGGDARVGWRAAPAQRERDFAGAFLEIESGEVATYRPGELRRNDVLPALVRRLQHLDVLARQQVAGARDIDRVAGQLDTVL